MKKKRSVRSRKRLIFAWTKWKRSYCGD